MNLRAGSTACNLKDAFAGASQANGRRRCFAAEAERCDANRSQKALDNPQD